MVDFPVAPGVLGQLFEHAPTAMALVRGGEFVAVNVAFARMFGLAAPAQAIGRPVRTCLPRDPDSPAAPTIELTGVRADGSRFPVRVQEHTIVDDGQPTVVAYFTDLTADHRAEQERKARLRHLETLNTVSRLLESDLEIEVVLERLLHELVSLFDCDRVILVYPADPEVDELSIPFQAARPGNAPFAAKFPMAPAARDAIRDALAAGHPIAHGTSDPLVATCLMSDDPTAHIQSLVILAIRPRIGKPWAFELQQVTYERRWTDDELRLFHDLGGRVADALSNMLLHRDLRVAKDRLAAIVENIEDAVVVSRADGRLEFANERAAQLLGAPSAAELVRQGAAQVERVVTNYSADGVRLTPHETPPAIARRERRPAQAVLQLQRDGEHERRIVSVRSVPLPAFEGDVDALLTSGRDVTELMNAQKALRESAERLRQAQKMEAIGRLAGGIAHDFNNLLTLINAYAHLAIERLADGEHDSLAADLAEIAHAGERAAALTAQLLAFSRQQVLEARVLDLNNIVRGMDRMLRTLLGERVRLELQLDPVVVPVRVDRTQMEQVLLNLATNARDAMPDGGRFILRTRRVASGSRLVVTDTGVGMSDTVKTHVFEPFFTTKPVGEGTGLGLASVYGIVAQSGGSIEIDTAPGRGTTFILAFPPASTGPDGAVGAPPPSPSPPQRRDETVLVVEDEPGVRRMVATVLRRRGFAVLEAGDGHEALAVLELHAPSVALVITDITMPHMNGLELTQRIARAHPDIRLLFMTGYAEGLGDDTSLARGAELLHKPFEPAALSAAIDRLIGAPTPRVAR